MSVRRSSPGGPQGVLAVVLAVREGEEKKTAWDFYTLMPSPFKNSGLGVFLFFRF